MSKENHQRIIIEQMYAEKRLEKALELLADATTLVIQCQSELDFRQNELFLAGKRN